MKKGQDIALQTGELFLVHHNKPGQKLDAHAHDEHHLFIPLRGRVEVDVGAKKLAVTEGRMLYLPASVEHAFSSDVREGERLIVLIDDRAWKKRKLPRVGALTLPTQQLLKELIYFMLLNPKSRAMPALITSFLEALGETLERSTELGSAAGEAPVGAPLESEPRLRAAVEWMNENFREPVKVSDIARAAGMTERVLTRMFAKELGTSPKNYLMRLRIEEAGALLAARRATVTTAAFEVGYNSLSAFIDAFRAVKGHLPSDHVSR